MNNFNIPILFIIFNRLETTTKVFKKIKEAAPARIYLASDGPRSNRSGEEKIVESVRKYVLNSVDWTCEVKTFFRETNLGCGKAVSEAITWFFENEEMGIILEDDCVPSNSFFLYCKKLLLKYKDDSRIFHIAGQNPLTLTKSPYSYYFARIQHCWGWASWRRAWNQYNFDIEDNIYYIKNVLNNIFKRTADIEYWLSVIEKMKSHRIDTWDYQWTYTIFKNNGFCINPTRNFVSNIGFNQDATHTVDSNSVFNNQKKFEIDEIMHPPKIVINNRIIKEINKISFGIQQKNIFVFIKKIIKKLYLKCN